MISDFPHATISTHAGITELTSALLGLLLWRLFTKSIVRHVSTADDKTPEGCGYRYEMRVRQRDEFRYVNLTDCAAFIKDEVHGCKLNVMRNRKDDLIGSPFSGSVASTGKSKFTDEQS